MGDCRVGALYVAIGLASGVAGCFHPTAAVGDPCSASGACPTSQTCIAGFCEAAGFEADAAVDAGGGDAAGTCSPTAAFGTPVPIASLNSTTDDDGGLRLLPDELTGFFWSARAGTPDIYAVTRADLASPFTIALVPELDTTEYIDANPTISPDGTTLVFDSTRGGGDQLYQATRTSPVTPFTAPVAITALNTALNVVQPSLPLVGVELFYATRAHPGQGRDVWSAIAGVDGYTLAAAVPSSVEGDGDGVNTTSNDDFPALSADGLTLYFRSDRGSDPDIYTATRASIGAAFGSATALAAVNSTGDDAPSWVSADDCRLYLASDRAGTLDVYVATRGM